MNHGNTGPFVIFNKLSKMLLSDWWGYLGHDE